MFTMRSQYLLPMRFRQILQNQVKCKSRTAYQEIKIPVPWGHISGKWWGPTDRKPVLTLHGWQVCKSRKKYTLLVIVHFSYF
jgi:hypothetical protein